MENDYDYYIYVKKGIIVKLVCTKSVYYPVYCFKTNSYKVPKLPVGIKPDQLLYNYKYSMREGFQKNNIDDFSDDFLQELKNTTITLTILEKFENAIRSYKSTVDIRYAPGEDIYHTILTKEIENYKQNKIVGSLLKAEQECSECDDIDTFIDMINFKYENLSEIFAYITYKSKEMDNLLKENKFEEGYLLIAEIYNKAHLS